MEIAKISFTNNTSRAQFYTFDSNFCIKPNQAKIIYNLTKTIILF